VGIKTRIDSTTNLKEVMGGERAGEYPQRVIRPQRVNAALLQTVEHTGADAVATDEITADVFVEGLFSHLSGGKIDKEQLPHVSAGHYFLLQSLLCRYPVGAHNKNICCLRTVKHDFHPVLAVPWMAGITQN
jgi:hypothetical protein